MSAVSIPISCLRRGPDSLPRHILRAPRHVCSLSFSFGTVAVSISPLRPLYILVILTVTWNDVPATLTACAVCHPFGLCAGSCWRRDHMSSRGALITPSSRAHVRSDKCPTAVHTFSLRWRLRGRLQLFGIQRPIAARRCIKALVRPAVSPSAAPSYPRTSTHGHQHHLPRRLCDRRGAR